MSSSTENHAIFFVNFSRFSHFTLPSHIMMINNFIMIVFFFFYLHEKQTATVGKNSRLVGEKILKYLIKWIKESRKHLSYKAYFIINYITK